MLFRACNIKTLLKIKHALVSLYSFQQKLQQNVQTAQYTGKEIKNIQSFVTMLKSSMLRKEMKFKHIQFAFR